MLGNVHTLNLSSCTRITDVSMLGNVQHLEIFNCAGIVHGLKKNKICSVM